MVSVYVYVINYITNTMIVQTLKVKILLFCIVLSLLFPRPVLAYLDPGTGSYIFQILIAGLLAALFFIKSIVRKLKEIYNTFFAKKKPAQEKDGN